MISMDSKVASPIMLVSMTISSTKFSMEVFPIYFLLMHGNKLRRSLTGNASKQINSMNSRPLLRSKQFNSPDFLTAISLVLFVTIQRHPRYYDWSQISIFQKKSNLGSRWKELATCGEQQISCFFLQSDCRHQIESIDRKSMNTSNHAEILPEECLFN